MEKRIISMFKNNTRVSGETCRLLRAKLENSGFCIMDGYVPESELMIIIGGDGTLLEAVHKYDFPDVPMIGVNTGHLGFFQEIHPDDLDSFIYNYKHEKYSLQRLKTVQASVYIDGAVKIHKGLNELVIRGCHSYSSHMNISIGNSFIERFSGDGILISTPSGSTAYNYSLGGAIVDPRLDLFQVTPMGPMNTTAYRSFTTSILLPNDMSLSIVPEYTKNNNTYILADGNETEYNDVQKIIVEFSDTVVNLMRFEYYDFWNKVKTKFL